MTTSAQPGTTAVRTVGIIGIGKIGSTVARLAVDAGLDVVIADSRGPETLRDTVADLGPLARAATAAEAAEAGDVVVVTEPLRAYRDVPAAPLAGEVVLDTGDHHPERDGRIAALPGGPRCRCSGTTTPPRPPRPPPSTPSATTPSTAAR